MITIHDPATFAELWQFDCETEEGRQTIIDWTEHPIESGAIVSDYGVEKPEQFNVAGLVTATPFDGPHDPSRLALLDGQLRALARKKQPITVSAGFYTAPAVIATVGGRLGQGDGDRVGITCTLKSIFIPTATLVTMPKARIKRRKKPRAAPKAAGGKAQGQKPTGPTVARRRSALKKFGGLLTGR